MRRTAILPILTLGLLAAFAPAQARQPGPRALKASVNLGRLGGRLGDKDEKPRKPKPKPGPRGGDTDTDN